MGELAIKQHQDKIPIFRIAGLNAAIAGAKFLYDLGKDYLIDDQSNPDISFDVTEDAMILKKNNPLIPWEKCCYIASARRFYTHMLNYSAFVLHASAVVLDGKAYLFSADSGVGKSTHTALWCKYFSSDRAYILNDDKPIIRKIESKYLAFGAPWCGSTCLGINKSAPIQGVVFLERSESDWIQPFQPREAIHFLLRQTDRTLSPDGIMLLLSFLEDFMASIPMYRMGCTISMNAVLMASKAMDERAGELICPQTV